MLIKTNDIYFTAIKCVNLPKWQGAVINDSSTDIGTAVNISCSLVTENSKLIFEDSTHWKETLCKSDGEWDPVVPECIGMWYHNNRLQTS